METMKKKQEITFRSKIPDIYIPNDRFPLHSYCFQNIHKFSTRPCLINGSTGDVYTFADVQLIGRKVAAGLHKLGIQKGDVIMLLVQNSPEFVFAFLGASQIGAICTMANPLLLQEDIVKQAKATNCRLVITQQSCIDKVKDLLANDIKGVKVVSIDTAPEGCLHFSELSDSPDGIRDVPKVKIDPEDPVAIFFSSGTTGLPKGAVLTHKALITGVAQQVDGENPHLYLHSEDVIMCVLPLFHVYAFVSVMLMGLRVGSAILLMQKFKITAYMELMERYKVTVAPAVPPILLVITKRPVTEIYDFSSVRMVLSAAAPMGKELEGAVRAKFPKATIGQLYGMTEAGSVISICMSLAKKPFKSKPGSCGTVVRNAEMKIVDPNTGVSLSRNQPGEICIRGQQLMKGYLNNQRATEETIDKEGWLHTGDIGYIDEDDEIYVVDRLKELIKYKGFQIAPAELEAILIAHPHISDAAVVPMKDEAAGEIPVAFITVNGNCLTISEDDIKLYISKQVVYYKKIHHVFLVDSIPKSSTGKILRKELREKLSRRAKY